MLTTEHNTRGYDIRENKIICTYLSRAISEMVTIINKIISLNQNIWQQILTSYTVIYKIVIYISKLTNTDKIAIYIFKLTNTDKMP